MVESELFIGSTRLNNEIKEISGDYVVIEGKQFYKIANYDAMRPFFMTVISGSDHWLFISSNGALTAGRKNPNSALFPYYTDDKIIDSAELTGSKSIFKVKRHDKKYLWEPFSDRHEGAYFIKRNLYKNGLGNKIVFEEINEELQLSFCYSWTFSEKFGFVKNSTIVNQSSASVELELLDGIQNILPYGIDDELQLRKSTLIDAYKKNELDVKSGLGQFMLSAMIVDKAEPSEALKTTSVWSAGIKTDNYLVSSLQLAQFRKGNEIENESNVRAERGAYFINGKLNIVPLGMAQWYIVAEVNQSISDVIDLQSQLKNPQELIEQLEKDVIFSSNRLLKLVAKADGLQLSNDKLITGRHFSNVLLNIMRGGVFEDNYEVDTIDLEEFIQTINRTVFDKHHNLLKNIPPRIDYQELLVLASDTNDRDFERIILEYLPLSFSRRHGDPSRPWNLFSINVVKQDGSKIRNYEGNWRDIFQNWEALAISFPDFIESMITKFVNASTIDGYNPYRITRNGIDWEVVEPGDPWAFIGYWGDHQLIYLLKLLELSDTRHPGKLASLLTHSVNVYANVPYKIKGYDAILQNSSDTIDFDFQLAKTIEGRVNKIGSDGKLVWTDTNEVLKANLGEKILVTVLTKLYNFIPEAGIWLNTQRPEWNDANNALVGNGVSMVTLYYLRRFLNFGIELFDELANTPIELNKPVSQLLSDVYGIYSSRIVILERSFSDVERRNMMDELGQAGEAYRKKAYTGFKLELKLVDASTIVSMFKVASRFVDHSIKSNERSDGLYHSYNLISLTKNEAKVDRLYEMLEGQVAVLTSQYLDADEALALLDALKRSKMYRQEQYSYMLYPNTELPTFLNKNTIPNDFVKQSRLIKLLVKEGDTSLFEQDVNGNYHFNGAFHNANDLCVSLTELALGKHKELVILEKDAILNVFEQMFNHKSFTGRSGTFYGYEGLGSIYWHMVSKLLVSVQENISAGKQKGSAQVWGKLVNHYYEIRAGIGVNKSPELYGAFPTDAYSHTPGNTGAQQPGMTGQVKEDIINRWAELGVIVRNGQIVFEPVFLRREEYLTKEHVFEYYNVDNRNKFLIAPSDSLVFTYCQVPIIYRLNHQYLLNIYFSDGTNASISDNFLTIELSNEVFMRTGKIDKIVFYQPI